MALMWHWQKNVSSVCLLTAALIWPFSEYFNRVGCILSLLRVLRGMIGMKRSMERYLNYRAISWLIPSFGARLSPSN